MFSGRNSAEKRREAIEAADLAVADAMAAINRDDVDAAREALSEAPKTHFADLGWKVGLAGAMIDLLKGRNRAATNKFVAVCGRLDDTSLSRDDKNYLRLYALYRTSEHSKDRKAPPALRDLVEDFRFDHTLVDPRLRHDFPLKKLDPEAQASVPPPPPPPPSTPGGPDEAV